MTTVESSHSIEPSSQQQARVPAQKPGFRFKLYQLFENPAMTSILTPLGEDLQTIVIFQSNIDADVKSGRASQEAMSVTEKALKTLCDKRGVKQEGIGQLGEHLQARFAMREKVVKRLLSREARVVDKTT